MTRFTRLFNSKDKSEAFSHYVALGDSMTTDDYPGKGKGAASLFLQNLDRLYPDFRGKDLATLYQGIEFLCLAFDGATSYDVLHQQLQALQVKRFGKVIFTVTAGGNDILSLQADAEDIIFRLRTIVNQLEEKFPTSVIIIGTIYDPTDGVGDLLESGITLDDEMKRLALINHAIREMQDAPRILVADIHRHFLGHGSHCKDQSNPYYHPEDPSCWFLLNIEPNERGAHEIRRLFWQSMTGKTHSEGERP